MKFTIHRLGWQYLKGGFEIPLYEYECGVCSHITSDLREIKDRNNIAICKKCGCVARHIVSHFNAISDTNFFATGKYDSRFGSVIEGRADWKRKLDEKGYVEASPKMDGFVTPTTVEERIKKHNLGVK